MATNPSYLASIFGEGEKTVIFGLYERPATPCRSWGRKGVNLIGKG